jgi:hypothetical protein
MNTLPLTQHWSAPLGLTDEALEAVFDQASRDIKEQIIRHQCLLFRNRWDDDVLDATFEDMGHCPLRFTKLPPNPENAVLPFTITVNDEKSIVSIINPKYHEPGLIQHSVRHKEGSPYPEFDVHRNLGGVRENLKVELKTFDPSWFDMEFIIQEYYTQCRGVMKKPGIAPG